MLPLFLCSSPSPAPCMQIIVGLVVLPLPAPPPPPPPPPPSEAPTATPPGRDRDTWAHVPAGGDGAHQRAASPTSALPMFAFTSSSDSSSSTNGSQALRVVLDNSTLVLPPADYDLLLAAALRSKRGCTGREALPSGPVGDGIRALIVADISAARHAMLISLYEGWGVRGTRLMVQVGGCVLLMTVVLGGNCQHSCAGLCASDCICGLGCHSSGACP